MMSLLAASSPPPRYHDEHQHARPDEDGIANMCVVHRVAESLGDEPANAELPRHALGSADTLAQHELAKRHMRKTCGGNDRRPSGRKNAPHHNDPRPPLLEQVFDLKDASRVKHASEEPNRQEPVGESPDKKHPDEIGQHDAGPGRSDGPPERQHAPLDEKAGGHNENLFADRYPHAREHDDAKEQPRPVLGERVFYLEFDLALERMRILDQTRPTVSVARREAGRRQQHQNANRHHAGSHPRRLAGGGLQGQKDPIYSEHTPERLTTQFLQQAKVLPEAISLGRS